MKLEIKLLKLASYFKQLISEFQTIRFLLYVQKYLSLKINYDYLMKYFLCLTLTFAIATLPLTLEYIWYHTYRKMDFNGSKFHSRGYKLQYLNNNTNYIYIYH